MRCNGYQELCRPWCAEPAEPAIVVFEQQRMPHLERVDMAHDFSLIHVGTAGSAGISISPVGPRRISQAIRRTSSIFQLSFTLSRFSTRRLRYGHHWYRFRRRGVIDKCSAQYLFVSALWAGHFRGLREGGLRYHGTSPMLSLALASPESHTVSLPLVHQKPLV